MKLPKGLIPTWQAVTIGILAGVLIIAFLKFEWAYQQGWCWIGSMISDTGKATWVRCK